MDRTGRERQSSLLPITIVVRTCQRHQGISTLAEAMLPLTMPAVGLCVPWCYQAVQRGQVAVRVHATDRRHLGQLARSILHRHAHETGVYTTTRETNTRHLERDCRSHKSGGAALAVRAAEND